MFRTVTLSIIRSFSLHTQQWYMSYRFADSLRAVSKPVWHIPLLCVQWKTRDDWQRNCPKHVEFYSKNKFEKFVRLFSFIVRIYRDARPSERQIIQDYFRRSWNWSVSCKCQLSVCWVAARQCSLCALYFVWSRSGSQATVVTQEPP